MLIRTQFRKFQRQDRSSCVVRSEELFTLEELKRAGGRLKARTAPGIDGVPNEILKEVIGAYPEILLEAFNSCLREGRFFADWKKQRLVLLRKGTKPLWIPHRIDQYVYWIRWGSFWRS